MARSAGWLRQRFLTPEYPLTAVEVRTRSVGVVRLVRDKGRLQLGSAASLELPPGTLQLSMVEPNIVDPTTFKTVLSSALERAGVLNAGRIALVLPDPVARVSLLPAGEVQGRRPSDVEEIVRFRLRKSVPFEIREAQVAWMALPPGAGDPMVLAGAIFRPVLEGYEQACRALRLDPGLVELAGLALHESQARRQADGDRLLVNWDDGYLSLILSRNGVPVLVRTLTGESAARSEEVVREVGATVIYYRERLGGAGLAGAAVRSASLPPAEAIAILEEPLGIAPEVVDPWSAVGASSFGLEAGQALAGAMACVAGRAA
jgi:Tfp pilus assembly PilM family ATPase